MLKQRGRFIPILALTRAGCLWGTGFFFGKVALGEMPVAMMGLFRFAVRVRRIAACYLL
jgi:drug/metabolite transporter (DMT)-like permease